MRSCSQQTRVRSVFALVLGLICSWTWQSAAADDTYVDEIKPLLAHRCFACHGALKQESGLRIDTVEAMIEAAIIDPGNPDNSILLERLTAEDELERMPPEGQPITAEEIATIERWISNGASAPEGEAPEPDPESHWSFLIPHAKPAPRMSGSPHQNVIDAWLDAARKERGISSAPEADRRTLIRRVYLDLVGLPPTLEQIDDFVNDPRPDAYQHLVDRLLASPQYGERWGRHWMDVWRYSDWFGLGAQLRYSQKHIWHWRDWIIESLNDDRGYDQMVREMLAADEISPTDRDALRATGFLARNYFLFNRTTWLDDTIEHTSKAFLGLTMNCAKCHDHKYDPITQADYYRMRAIFEPHHVRLDPVPGTLNLVNNGLPRAYDLHLERPTYIHIGGDAKRPDETRVIQPGVPSFLEQASFPEQPFELPLLAHRPDLQPFVQQARLDEAMNSIDVALVAVEQATQKLQSLQVSDSEQSAFDWNRFADSTTNDPWLIDEFSTIDETKWQISSGEWEATEEGVTQSQVGASSAILKSIDPHPTNFVAKLQFTTHGGNQWMSVGISFDVTDTHDVLVYMSAVEPGSKVQVSFGDNNQYAYPADGKVDREVKKEQQYELGLAVVGRLVNVYIDDEFMLAFELPIERQTGQLGAVAFDAHTTFHSMVVHELDSSTQLVGAGGMPLTIADAQLGVELAEAVLEREQAFLAALRASYESYEPSSSIDAHRAFRIWKASELQAKVAQLRIEAAKAPSDQARQNAVNTALDELMEARDGIEQPGQERVQKSASEKALEGPDEKADTLNLPFPQLSTGRRRTLAAWITDPRNPLTARVAVNHVWTRHFGRPLVSSMTDFGRRAPEPALLDLLDQLAIDFVASGWSMKHLHRQIVTSDVYRMTGMRSPDLAKNFELDRDNETYWIREPMRMESQLVHDSLRSLAGQLDLKMGGASIPIDHAGLPSRRSLYFEHSRDAKHMFLSMFDDADILRCYRREESVIPQQALALANSRLAIESARAITTQLGERVDIADSDAFITAAFQWLLSATPSDEERQECRKALLELQSLAAAKGHPSPEKRAAENFILALLNCNDFITIR